MGQILKKLFCETCCRCCQGEEVDWEKEIITSVVKEANTTNPEDLPERWNLVTQNLVKMDDDDEDKKDVDQKDLKKNDADDSVLSVGDGDPNTPSDKVTDLVTDHLDTMEEKNGAIEEEKIDPSFTVVDKTDSDVPNNDI